MDHIEVLVVGAGVVGLACARALAQAGHEVWIAEREAAIGTGVSSRNSEVVHAGLYHATDSLKTRLCVQGREQLYAYCAAHGVPHRRCGKLVVAVTDAECAALQRLLQQAQANGVQDLQWLQAEEARALEPALQCRAALLSPSSGIVDSHALMLSLLGQAEAAGAVLALHTRVLRAQRQGGHWQVEVCGSDGEHAAFSTRWLVNAAGLGAQALARALQGFPADAIPPLVLAKGHYFALAGRAPFSRLIYPLPVAGGLGVHLTLDLAGQARFGPDVQWLSPPADDAGGDPGPALDYRVDASRAPAFEAAVRPWWPDLPAGALQPAYTGVRPKLCGPGEPAADFRIDGPAQHGCPGVLQLFGIESPGLTAALAIADDVVQRIRAATAATARPTAAPAQDAAAFHPRQSPALPEAGTSLPVNVS